MRRVAILVFEGVDLLDVGGPYEVLLTASRLAQRRNEPTPFEVVTVGVDRGSVTAHGGLGLTPQVGLDDVGAVHVAIVPGLIDVGAGVADEALVAAVQRLADRSAEVVGSVCTGAFLLEAADLLDGAATTHFEDLPRLADRIGERAIAGVRWVDSGRVVTAAGLSAGIAMALHLVDRLVGRELAEATAHQIGYDWDPESGRTLIG